MLRRASRRGGLSPFPATVVCLLSSLFLVSSVSLAALPGVHLPGVAGIRPELLAGSLADGGLLVVAFDPQVDDRRRRALVRGLGGRALQAIADHGLLVHLPAAKVGSLAARPEVRGIEAFHPGWRLAPPLRDATTLSAGTELRLTTASFMGDRALRRAVRGTGAEVLEQWPSGLRVRVASLEQALALARLDGVLFVEPRVEARLYNDSSRGICQTSEVGNERVHQQGIRGLDEIIAVMDSGIDTGHCCFDAGGKIVDNRAWGGGVLGALCGNDHGTHVSGTAACSNAGDHDGLAPEAKIILQDIQAGGFAACTLGSVSPPSDLASAWSDAYGQGARIHTNSWGGGGNFYASGAREIDRFMWENQDFLILYAAGNGGSSPGSLGNYSNAKNSITVGGTVNGANHENMYSASSRGPAGDGRMLPDLLAPAQGVSSARNQANPSCGWFTASGTSMATPAAAGSAALVREYYRRGYYPSGAANAADGFAPSAALIKATMLASTRNMTGTGTRGDRPNSDQGFGRVTLDDALWFSADAPAERLRVLDDRNTATGLSTDGEEQVFEIGLRSAAALKVMLTWTDAPGSSSASKALVNDLDLIVTLADGTTYRGNQGFEGGWTVTPSEQADRLNNKEAVFLASPFPGPVTITVRAETLGDVALHDQDFALVVVGDSPPACSDNSGATGVGPSVLHERVGADLLATWDTGGATRWTVYRGDTPDFMKNAPAPYREGVVDEDASRPGVQWTDAGAAEDGQNHYYYYFALNDCDELLP
ncbi:MAG: S8 family serine peptidase [Acidobacteriota bacterium]|nr:S8 family serine peptidase [Acidobacteriota bacterium]